MSLNAPITGHSFDVDLGDPAFPAGNYTSVIFPEFGLDDRAQAPLILRRPLTDARDVQIWWSDARRIGERAARTIVVTLNGSDPDRHAMRWRFIGARPISLSYSPLDAAQAMIVYETLTLAFAGVEFIDDR